MPTGKGRTGFAWDGDAYKALAVTLARVHGTFSPAQQDAVVEEMTSKGFLTSWEGIRQHLQKLKREGPAGPAGPAVPSTPPPKAGKGGMKKSTPASSQKRGRKPTVAANVDEDEDEKILKKPKLEMDTFSFAKSYGDDPSQPEDGEI